MYHVLGKKKCLILCQALRFCKWAFDPANSISTLGFGHGKKALMLCYTHCGLYKHMFPIFGATQIFINV